MFDIGIPVLINPLQSWWNCLTFFLLYLSENQCKFELICIPEKIKGGVINLAKSRLNLDHVNWDVKRNCSQFKSNYKQSNKKSCSCRCWTKCHYCFIIKFISLPLNNISNVGAKWDRKRLYVCVKCFFCYHLIDLSANRNHKSTVIFFFLCYDLNTAVNSGFWVTVQRRY